MPTRHTLSRLADLDSDSRATGSRRATLTMKLEVERTHDSQMNLLRHLAFVLADNGERAAALENAERACELSPRDPGAWSDRGCVHAMLGELRQAVVSYARALEIDCDFTVGWHNLGVTLARLGYARAAFRALRHAQMLDGKRARTCLEMGKLLADAGLLDAALANFARAEQLTTS
jgi:Flp pilus assembly protein TadD